MGVDLFLFPGRCDLSVFEAFTAAHPLPATIVIHCNIARNYYLKLLAVICEFDPVFDFT